MVIISSWAFDGLDAMRKLWKARQLPSVVYTKAISSPFDFDPSSFEGDVPDFTPEQKSHFVQVDPFSGLQEEQLDDYVRILTGE